MVPRGDYTMCPQNAKLFLPNSSLYNQPDKHSTDVSLLQAPALCSAQDGKVCPASPYTSPQSPAHRIREELSASFPDAEVLVPR